MGNSCTNGFDICISSFYCLHQFCVVFDSFIFLFSIGLIVLIHHIPDNFLLGTRSYLLVSGYQ